MKCLLALRIKSFSKLTKILQEEEYVEVDTEFFADCDLYNPFWISWNNTGNLFSRLVFLKPIKGHVIVQKETKATALT